VPASSIGATNGVIVVNLARHRGAFAWNSTSTDSTPGTFDLGENRDTAAGIGLVFTTRFSQQRALIPLTSNAQDASLAVTLLGLFAEMLITRS
jgi:hypothetical protein